MVRHMIRNLNPQRESYSKYLATMLCLSAWYCGISQTKKARGIFMIWLDMECPRHSHTSCVCSSTNNKFSVRAPSPWLELEAAWFILTCPRVTLSMCKKNRTRVGWRQSLEYNYYNRLSRATQTIDLANQFVYAANRCKSDIKLLNFHKSVDRRGSNVRLLPATLRS